MKKLHKILPVIVLAIVVLLAPVIRAEAAEGKPGQTVTVTFIFNDVRGLDGSFVFSNREMFSNVSYSSSFPGARFNNDKIFYSTSAAGTSNGTVTVTATIKEDASIGSTCTIALDNINVTDANTNSVYSGSKSEVVTVVKEPVSNQIPVQVPENPSSQTQNQNQNQSQPQTNNQQNDKTSSGNKSSVNLTELKKQIEIANGLDQSKYTKASWDAYMVALNNAKSALNSGNQSTVDNAAQSLKNAITSLVEVDYSKLQKAIDDANSYIDSDATAALIKQIMTAVSNGSTLLESADQAAIDKAAEEINKLLNQALEGINAGASANAGGNTIIAEPDYDYCNITMHKVWPILFFISLAANIALVLLIVLGIRRKRIRTGEDMPLVDYDIEEDDTIFDE